MPKLQGTVGAIGHCSLLRVDWDTLTSEVCLYNKYTAHLLYESPFLKPFLFMKDPRLEMLLKGYEDATLLGFADGAGKVLLGVC